MGIGSIVKYSVPKKKICNYEAYQEEIKIPEIRTEPFDLETVSNADFSLSTFTCMIYCCLVDADFLDTEYFMKWVNEENWDERNRK